MEFLLMVRKPPVETYAKTGHGFPADGISNQRRIGDNLVTGTY
jgi:hypothetical protein